MLAILIFIHCWTFIAKIANQQKAFDKKVLIIESGRTVKKPIKKYEKINEILGKLYNSYCSDEFSVIAFLDKIKYYV